MDQLEAVIVLTTWPAARDAAPLANALVHERLAACVSVLPSMESVYRWQEQVEHDQERQVVIKTIRARLADLEARVKALHPYEVPEWLVLPVAASSDAYLAWLGASVHAR